MDSNQKDTSSALQSCENKENDTKCDDTITITINTLSCNTGKTENTKFTCKDGVCYLAPPTQPSSHEDKADTADKVENTITNTLIISLNPYMSTVPTKFIRYRHPSHRHKLFLTITRRTVYCDNQHCQNSIDMGETVFTCFRCDFDLCSKCFQLNSTEEVPLAEDDCDVNETTFVPFSTQSFNVVC